MPTIEPSKSTLFGYYLLKRIQHRILDAPLYDRAADSLLSEVIDTFLDGRQMTGAEQELIFAIKDWEIRKEVRYANS